ncbi:ABC transporter permease subunit [Exiguobacterium flavidum]|uniref:ABC transporter permease subunit n=1 Tax=Exiguobacterium flavidum TaxID=2184695 RepID=UPI000DF7A1D8|nr:ABC transporter permease subunit [Exiguobacterium flavidum]
MMLLVWSLFKQNLKPILAYSIGTSLYLLMLAALFPTMTQTGVLEAKLEALPPEMLKVFKFDSTMLLDSVLALLASNYYGVIFEFIATFFVISLAARLFARPIDGGELILYLAAPITRHRYTFAALSTMLLAAFIFVVLNGVTLQMSDWLIPDVAIDTVLLWRLQLNAFALLAALSAFTLFVATLFDDERRAFALSAGVLIFSIVASILSGLSESFEWVKYLSVFTLFDANAVVKNDEPWLSIGLLFTISILFFSATFVSFHRRDLSI